MSNAFREMLQRMVFAMRLGVALHQLRIQLIGRMAFSKGIPRPIPGFSEGDHWNFRGAWCP
jgi:hypothetical protein